MKSPDGWIGENTLGKIWMKIREEDALKEPENQSRAVDFLVGKHSQHNCNWENGAWVFLR